MVYTRFYSKIDFLDKFTPKLHIVIDSSERWICCQQTESTGKGYEHTLIDNFCETYSISSVFDENKRLHITDKSGSLAKIGINLSDSQILLRPNQHFLVPLPDFAIDVLQSTGTSVGRETLYRIAKVYGEKYYKNKL
jgi:hypothetical protein